jgi:hypothetical protein
MTINIGETVFFGAARFCRVGVAIALLGIAGCSSTNTSGPVPMAENAGPKDTGTFPNLNIPPKVAADQITDQEKAAQTTDLRATQQGAATTAAGLGQGMTDPALLRKIAAQHAADALKKINAQN